MKAHIRAVTESGQVHTVTMASANVANIPEMTALPHHQGKTVFANARYSRVERRK